MRCASPRPPYVSKILKVAPTSFVRQLTPGYPNNDSPSLLLLLTNFNKSRSD